MARTPSIMLDLGTQAPAFTLPEPATGTSVSLSNYTGQPVMIVFLCNHCPYVKHIASRLGELGEEYAKEGVVFIAINSNDADNYPDDAPEKMADFMREYGIGFHYLYDETQAVAKQYKAACTPDFYLFDSNHALVYRGQFDGARPHNAVPVSGDDLRGAINALLANMPVNLTQIASLGCNIKWKPGNEPAYYAG